MVWVWWRDIDLADAIADPWLSGYWFTVALWMFFIIDEVRRRLLGNHVMVIIGYAMAVYAVPLILKNLTGTNETISYWVDVFKINQLDKYPYFALGLLIKKVETDYPKVLNHFTSRKIVLLASLIIAAICMRGGISCNGVFFHAYTLIMNSAAIVAAWILVKYSIRGAETSRIVKLLSIVGQHTLYIYLLHYFFLPWNLGTVGQWLTENPNLLIELVLTLTICAAIIAICMALEFVIKKNKEQPSSL